MTQQFTYTIQPKLQIDIQNIIDSLDIDQHAELIFRTYNKDEFEELSDCVMSKYKKENKSV